jgi:drug/metabolite transporter (DMT)-like permease
MTARPMLRGSLFAMGAAACFGGTVPAVQYFSRDVGPWSTAALLYCGAVVGALRITGATGNERFGRAEVLRLATVAVLGAALAPALLAMGLHRIDGASASLLLDFEAAFTVLLARALYREVISRRMIVALAVMTAGGFALIGPSLAAPRLALGSAAVLGAVLCWALDSALTRPLAELDPPRVVLGKSAIGVTLSLGVALAAREPLPGVAGALGLLACGAIGYGVGLQLYLLAQRHIGAARTASVFATAPFFGAAVALAAAARAPGLSLGLAGGLLAMGTWLLATERHEHSHEHAGLEHEHLHRHDDGHHDHAHAEPVAGEHSHPHRHEGVVHSHPHADDDHHRHEH